MELVRDCAVINRGFPKSVLICVNPVEDLIDFEILVTYFVPRSYDMA